MTCIGGNILRLVPDAWRPARSSCRLMPMLKSPVLIVALSVGIVAAAGAQSIPVRRTGVPTAASTEPLGATVLMRALSDGRVLVNDVVNRRVMLFDATLKS